ncbi:hypothetical protein ACTHAM_001015 [Cellulomonas soli]|uniref:hypothetical protein n=1 Tax=Cellulomonas soli TaxID=931535 RepID=UPI003F867A1B
MWLEIVGWTGSLLVIVSLTQARVLRFRVLNLVGSVIAAGYNAIVGIWPFAVMNGVIALINVYWLVRLQRERHDDRAYEVVEVTPDDAYLRHVLAVHADDIEGFSPGFVPRFTAAAEAGDGARAALLVVRGDETVGVVVVRGEGDGTGVVELDYVTPRFRDFTPGEFVYRRSGVFGAHGFERLLVTGERPESREYLTRVGFSRVEGGWERAVEVAA